jgi:hypothetical protein
VSFSFSANANLQMKNANAKFKLETRSWYSDLKKISGFNPGRSHPVQ